MFGTSSNGSTITCRIWKLATGPRNDKKERCRVSIPAGFLARRIAFLVNWGVGVCSVLLFFLFGRISMAPSNFRLLTLLGILLLPIALGVKVWSPSSFQFGNVVGGGAPPGLDLALLFGGLLPV